MKNLIDIKDLSVNEIEELIKVAKDIMLSPEKYSEKCKHKKLATLFFEPSTRTRLSFEAAMMELGGNVIGFSSADSSSSSKGESVSDTIRVVGCYSDIIAMRHPKEGAPLVASLKSTVPIINAGDGGHNHPTQTLTDLLTISCEKGRLDNLTIGLCGDLKFGRTVHSLITAMSRYKNIKFVLISPEELRIPEYIKEEILEECSKLDELCKEIDEAKKEILRLNKKRMCPKCYAEINIEDQFCPKCGEKQTEEKTILEIAEEKLEETEIKPEKKEEAEIVKEELEEKNDNKK